MSPIKTITSVLKTSTDIIINIPAQPIGLTEINATAKNLQGIITIFPFRFRREDF
jgi:hypothetical protein